MKNKHTKTVVNATIQFFESRYQKKYLGKVFLPFVRPPQNDGHVRFLRNWTETMFWWRLIFSNFTKIRHLVYWKCIIWAKSDLPIISSVFKKFWFAINGLWKWWFLIFAFFVFPNFKWLLPKILWKNHPFL